MSINVTNEDFNLLKKISHEIDEYFKAPNSNAETRSTDIYDYLKKKEFIKEHFRTGKEFNQFLRKMQKSGIFKAVIPNSIVDTSDPHFYQWRFYKKSKF